MAKFIILPVTTGSQPVAVNPEHVARVVGKVHSSLTVAIIILANGERIETEILFDEALRLLQGAAGD
jgi:hypothetical protein